MNRKGMGEELVQEGNNYQTEYHLSAIYLPDNLAFMKKN